MLINAAKCCAAKSGVPAKIIFNGVANFNPIQSVLVLTFICFYYPVLLLSQAFFEYVGVLKGIGNQQKLSPLSDLVHAGYICFVIPLHR